MAKLFKGKLPSDQREISIVEIEGGETVRSWDAGLDRRQAMRLVIKKAGFGARYRVRNVIVTDGGRGEIVRELRVLTDGMTYAGGEVPVDYR